MISLYTSLNSKFKGTLYEVKVELEVKAAPKHKLENPKAQH